MLPLFPLTGALGDERGRGAALAARAGAALVRGGDHHRAPEQGAVAAGRAAGLARASCRLRPTQLREPTAAQGRRLQATARCSRRHSINRHLSYFTKACVVIPEIGTRCVSRKRLQW